MKKPIFTLLISGSFLIVNAQTNAEVTKGETLSCRTEQTSYLNLDENEKIIQINNTKTENKKSETTVIKNGKKHFLKKVLSNFQGADIKDAWGIVSIN